MINLDDALLKLLSDLEESSPNFTNSLSEIYPITFTINIEGFKKIFISLDHQASSIGFEEENTSQFEIKGSIKDFIKTLSTRKLHKQLITGDAELAVVFFNAVIKLDIDILYLINKNFGDIPALMTKEALNIIFNHERTHQNKEERKIRNRLRQLSIRMDRLEAMRDI